jgi:3-ketoacyl-CoA synthase
VRLGKELMSVAARALRANMTSLGPLVLPLSEQLLFAANMAARKLAGGSKSIAQQLPAAWVKPYTPDFKRAFEHMCIHTGGRGVIDTIERELALPKPSVEPSRAALYQFGNTSSTSIWWGGAGGRGVLRTAGGLVILVPSPWPGWERAGRGASL